MLYKQNKFPSQLTSKDFKYTTNIDRILWTVSVYPILQQILFIVNNIPYNTFPTSISGSIYDLIAPDDLETEEQWEVSTIKKEITLENVKLTHSFFPLYMI